MTSTTVPTTLFSIDDLARACALVAARTGLAFGDRRLHVLEEGCLDGARHHGYIGEMQSHDMIAQYLDALETAETNFQTIVTIRVGGRCNIWTRLRPLKPTLPSGIA